jgi:hypothetical protein
VKENSDGIAVICFTAGWSGPCRMFASKYKVRNVRCQLKSIDHVFLQLKASRNNREQTCVALRVVNVIELVNK